MARALFTNQTPGITDESDGAPGLTLGTVMRTSSAKSCAGVWWYYPTGNPTQTIIGLLYRVGDEAELARANFVSPTLGTWNLATFASPVDLDADTNYCAAIWTPDRYVATAGLHSGTITNGTFTSPADTAELRNGRFASGASPAFPANSFNSNGYFPDLDIVDETPVAASAVLTMSGGLAAAAVAVQPAAVALTMSGGLAVAGTVIQPASAALTAQFTLTPGTTTAQRQRLATLTRPDRLVTASRPTRLEA